MTIKVLVIDLGKRYFHIHGIDSNGILVTRKKLKRKELLLFLSNLEPSLIGMEACGGAHYLARKCAEFGHEFKLMAAKFIKPYVKSSKNNFLDAEAICEAVQGPNMGWVVPKQSTTGGKTTLLDIGKRGNTRLRCNLIHGVRSALQWHIDKPSRWSAWAQALKAAKKPNVVAVAMANKMARMIWVILARNEEYQAVA